MFLKALGKSLRILPILLIVANPVFADGGAAHLLELTGGTRGALDFSDGANSYDLSLGADYRVQPYLQLGGTFDYTLVSSGGADAARTVMLVGPVLDLPPDGDVRDAFFVSARMGFTDPMLGPAEFTWAIGGGKRFRLGDRVSYKPAFQYTKANDMNGVFSLIPLQFSLFFL